MLNHECDSGPPLVSLKGVSKTYRSDSGPVEALRNADFQARAGECVAVMGPSGSGKTTLLGVIAGLIAPDPDGEVVVEGKSWAKLSDSARATHRRRSIAFVHQAYNLIDFMSVRENVMLPLLMNGERTSAARDRAGEALAMLQLEGMEERRPRELSGGQQQRAAIARAMAAAQPLLLADEPTGALDTITSHIVFKAIREHASERGLAVVVSHNPMASDYADRTITINDGMISGPEH